MYIWSIYLLILFCSVLFLLIFSFWWKSPTTSVCVCVCVCVCAHLPNVGVLYSSRSALILFWWKRGLWQSASTWTRACQRCRRQCVRWLSGHRTQGELHVSHPFCGGASHATQNVAHFLTTAMCAHAHHTQPKTLHTLSLTAAMCAHASSRWGIFHVNIKLAARTVHTCRLPSQQLSVFAWRPISTMGSLHQHRPCELLSVHIKWGCAKWRSLPHVHLYTCTSWTLLTSFCFFWDIFPVNVGCDWPPKNHSCKRLADSPISFCCICAVWYDQLSRSTFSVLHRSTPILTHIRTCNMRRATASSGVEVTCAKTAVLSVCERGEQERVGWCVHLSLRSRMNLASLARWKQFSLWDLACWHREKHVFVSYFGFPWVFRLRVWMNKQNRTCTRESQKTFRRERSWDKISVFPFAATATCKNNNNNNNK
jgi:hypothetical protein